MFQRKILNQPWKKKDYLKAPAGQGEVFNMFHGANNISENIYAEYGSSILMRPSLPELYPSFNVMRLGFLKTIEREE